MIFSLIALAMTIGGLFFGVIQPLILAKIIDLLVSANGLAQNYEIIQWIIIIFLFKGLEGTFQLFQAYFVNVISHRIVLNLKMDLYINILRLPIRAFDKMKKGEFISRFESDINCLAEILTFRFSEFIVDVFKVLIIGIIVFRINFLLALFLTIMFPISYYSYYRFGQKIRKETIIVRQWIEQYLSLLQESLIGIKEIKELFIEKVMEKKMRKMQENMIHKNIHKNMINAYSNYLNILIAALSTVGVLFLGSRMIFLGTLTLGNFVAFNSYSTRFNNSLFNITKLNANIQETLVSMKRIFEMLDYLGNEDPDQKTRLPLKMLENFDGKIEINNLTFEYNEGEEIFKNLNLKFQPNQWNGLVGYSGIGKTTLFKIILAFYKPKEGEVLLDGVNITELDLKFIRQKIAYVSQEPFFFNASIKENLQYADPKVSDVEIIDVCKKVKIHDYIDGLKEKYSSPIEEMAANFSSGQKQRLAIARAMLKKPRVFLLDEPTSSLDGETKKGIISLLQNLTKNHTVIVISHDNDLIKHCDKVFIIDHMRVIAEGSYQSILEKNPNYSALFSDNK